MLENGGTAGSTDGLGAEIGQMLGDFASDPVPNDQGDGTNAGAPPADAPLADSQPAPTPDAVPEGERPVDGDAPAPTTPDALPVADEPDPLASAESLKYTVNGQERTLDGIKVLGDEAIITKEALPDVIRRLGERDNLYEQNQWAHQERQRTEALGAWKATDDQGNERMLTGHAGIAEMRVSHARLEAALNTMVSALQDPQRLPQMVALDESGNIVLNPSFIQTLLTESELSEIKAEQTQRSLIWQLQSAATTAAQPAPDFKSFAPAIIKQAAGDKLSVLSPKDQQNLGQQMLRYVRPTTPQERAQGHGAHIVDAEFATLVSEWIEMRSDGAKAATVASTASTSNAARLAAARQGAPARPVARPATPAVPAPAAGESDQDLAWQMRERAIAGRITR